MSTDYFDVLPAMLPPSGITSNFVDPPTLYGYIIATSAVCLSITLVSFAIRIYTKIRLLKSHYWEDYICSAAAALFVAFVAICVWAGELGAGRHQWDVSVNQAFKVLSVINNLEILYDADMALAKVSILLQLRRIFSGSQNGVVRIITTMLIWANILFYAAAALAEILACIPRDAIWDPFIPGKCINAFSLFLVSSSINLVSDVLIFLLPIAYTWRLVLPWRQKLGVYVVFAAGAFACGAAVMRLVASVGLTETSDLTYKLAIAGLWAEAEIATVIICSCMPYLPRFIGVFLPERAGTSYAENSKYGARRATYGAGYGGDRDIELANSRITMEKGKLKKQISEDGSVISPTPSEGYSILQRPQRALHIPIQINRISDEDRIMEEYEGSDGWLTAVEMDDTSLPPQVPSKESSYSLRKHGSGSLGVGSTQSQDALNALAGRYWRDVFEDNTVSSRCEGSQGEDSAKRSKERAIERRRPQGSDHR